MLLIVIEPTGSYHPTLQFLSTQPSIRENYIHIR